MNKKQYTGQKGKSLGRNQIRGRLNKKQSGFVALFFVVTIASFLTMLIYGLSRSFSYTLTMLDSFRNTDRARSSVLYCKYKLFNNTLLNIEYTPVLNVDVKTPYNSVCIYKSFQRVDAFTREVIISGKNGGASAPPTHGDSPTHITESTQASLTFTIKYTYSINDGLYDYVKDVQTLQVQ